MFSDINKLRRNIILLGSLLIVAPVAMMGVAGWVVMQRMSQTAGVNTPRTSDRNLAQLTKILAGMCLSYHDEIVAKLSGGKRVFDEAGKIGFDQNRRFFWKAKSETTGQETEVELPVMTAGGSSFVPVTDITKRAPLVDEIQRRFGTDATVFQRVNESGDMLRVASSEVSKDGGRAIGSYLSAGAGGQGAQILKAVLAGGRYLSKAAESGTRSMAAYEPLLDEGGKVVGMLHTAMPEAVIGANFREAANVLVSRRGEELFVLRAGGDWRGSVLLMSDRSLEGHRLWDERDSSGRAYVQEICMRATTLAQGETGEYRYQKVARTGGVPRAVTAHFAYVPEWDWVIGFTQADAYFLSRGSNSQAMAMLGLWIFFGVGVAGAGLSIRVLIHFADEFAEKLVVLSAGVTKDAKGMEATPKASLTGDPSDSVDAAPVHGPNVKEPAHNLLNLAKQIDQGASRVSVVEGVEEKI